MSYIAVDDEKTLKAFHTLSQTEGIVPALESSHAIAAAEDIARGMTADQAILINLSGRGDKDIDQVIRREAEASGASGA